MLFVGDRASLPAMPPTHSPAGDQRRSSSQIEQDLRHYIEGLQAQMDRMHTANVKLTGQVAQAGTVPRLLAVRPNTRMRHCLFPGRWRCCSLYHMVACCCSSGGHDDEEGAGGKELRAGGALACVVMPDGACKCGLMATAPCVFSCCVRSDSRFVDKCRQWGPRSRLCKVTRS
jgi:hypothetical protein